VQVLTGISVIGAEGQINIYPNPAEAGSTWHLTVPEQLIGITCDIYNVEGQVVYSAVIQNTTNDITLRVAKGVYVLRLASGKDSYSMKLVRF
jgi:hypothetical protein